MAKTQQDRSNWVAVQGNTYPVKDRLKEQCGAWWEPEDKCWLIAPDKLAEAQAIVESAPTPAPRANQTSSASRAPGPTKQCWECGCAFTHRDAKENDGSWSESYCGC